MENKKGLHKRSIYNQNYDFKALIEVHPELASFVKKNKYDDLGVDYSNPKAVLCINQALLILNHLVKNWSVPKGNLCPPVPGRTDYIHYLADLLAEDFEGDIPVGTKVKGLDVGVGSSCIYPILGNSIYGWKFVGCDTSSDSINHANSILNSNPKLKKNIKLRFQDSLHHIFKGIIKFDEQFDFTICNPPFYSSLKEAKKNSDRKIRNLNINKEKKGHATNTDSSSNFGGLHTELWCQGGEVAFIKNMIRESEGYKENCNWFTTLVSNKDHLPELQKALKELDQVEVRVIETNQGQKISHILAWRFDIISDEI